VDSESRKALEADDGLTRGEMLAVGAEAAVAFAAAVHRRRRHRHRHPPKHRRPKRRPAPVHTGTIRDVDHVVIVTQENRSFDNYFGTLRGVRGFADPHAIKLPSGRPVFYQPWPGAAEGYLLPWHLDPTTSSPCNVLVNNGWDQMHRALDGGAMDAWTGADGAGPYSMAYQVRADVPWQMALADAFTVCDGYHCSVLGATNPNRYMMWTGTIDPHGRNGGPAIDNSGTAYSWTTYPERLTRAGISWRVYHEADDFDDNVLKYFTQYQQAPPTSPLYQNAMVNRPPEAFAEDVANGRLPQVSWLVAPQAESEHPGNGPAVGADWSERALRALAAHQDVWARTALFLHYDENGGYFDHVVPPLPPAGTTDEFVNGSAIGLGFRVPMIVCSPWSRGGYVCSDTFDHTSLIRFLEARFGVIEPQISAWRRQTCGDLTSAFDFRHADLSFPTLPDTYRPAVAERSQCQSNPTPLPPVALQGGIPAQEPGTRPRRVR
jgi:phospholipase C